MLCVLLLDGGFPDAESCDPGATWYCYINFQVSIMGQAMHIQAHTSTKPPQSCLEERRIEDMIC